MTIHTSEGALFRFKLSHSKYITKSVLYKIVIAIGIPLEECREYGIDKIDAFFGMDLEDINPE